MTEEEMRKTGEESIKILLHLNISEKLSFDTTGKCLDQPGLNKDKLPQSLRV